MPPGFDLHDAKADVWMPLGLDPAERTQNRGSHFLYLVGRLAPTASLATANVEMTRNLAQWGKLNPGVHAPNDSTHRLQIAPLRDEVIGNVRSALWILQGAVFWCCSSPAPTSPTCCSSAPRRDTRSSPLRSALGAAKSRMLRQFVAEGLVLTVLGAVLGLAAGAVGAEAVALRRTRTASRGRRRSGSIRWCSRSRPASRC